MTFIEKIEETAAWLQNEIDFKEIETAIVLGSGLGSFADGLEVRQTVDFKDIPHFKTSSVAGHGNQLIAGNLSGKRIVIMKGRIHYYEGNSMEEVTLPIRVFAKLGIKKLILTNAAGGLTGDAGQIMVIEDHLDLFCPNPLIGENLDLFGTRFPDLSEVYSRKMRDLALSTAAIKGIALSKGVYAYLTGPSYETPMDIKVLKQLGVDAVGMSTIPEAIVAVHSGIEVLGLSCITNLAAGISDKPLSHQEVVETTGRVADSFDRLLRGIIEGI